MRLKFVKTDCVYTYLSGAIDSNVALAMFIKLLEKQKAAGVIPLTPEHLSRVKPWSRGNRKQFRQR